MPPPSLPAGAVAPVTAAGLDLIPLPHRALWAPAVGTLLVADIHWGKAATMRADRVPIPAGTTTADLARLDAALAATGARTLVVLGDLLHARRGRHPAAPPPPRPRAAPPAALDIRLVRGNHDHAAGDPPPDLGIRCVDAPHTLGHLTLHHHPPADPEIDVGSGASCRYWLAGHLHPVVRLAGRGRGRLRLPCFHFGRLGGILPAFGSFTGGVEVAPDPEDRVFAVVDGEVVEVWGGGEGVRR